jgi:hypothetical protein
MLRNVLEDYLSRIQERDFDLPLLAVLPPMGFFDIHFTHGQTEFGKDIIAKRVESGVTIQYSFQSKAGDISQAEWRNNIMGQMLEAILIGLSHPNFDKSLPHQSILVLTGRLVGNAPLGLQDLNNTIEKKYKLHPIVLWDRDELISCLAKYGIEGVYRSTTSDILSYGNFFILYGKCVQGDISEREIERHFQKWLDETLPANKILLAATVEAEIIAQKCIQNGFLYEAAQTYLSIIRTILFFTYGEADKDRHNELLDLYYQADLKFHEIGSLYLKEVRQNWLNADKNLVRIITGPGGMFTYLVQCARIMEMAGVQYFLETDDTVKQDIVSFLDEFMAQEPGCVHIPSDRYAVSMVLPILALYDCARGSRSQEFIHKTVVWLCNRVKNGMGLASFSSSPMAEISKLLGYPFEFISQEPISASFLSTVLCDLAAFLNNPQFYSDVVNDFKACGIFSEYWQVLDTKGLFQIDTPELITYPNVEPKDNISQFENYDYAEHIIHEPRSFRITELVNTFCLMEIMLLLRDRYFPTIWLSLVQREVNSPSLASA